MYMLKAKKWPSYRDECRDKCSYNEGWVENTAAWAAAEDSSSVYCNSDEPIPTCPYGCWHWSGKKLLCGLKSGPRSAGKPTGEDHFPCWSSREQLKDVPSSMNTLTGTYTAASVHDCCHMLKSPQAPLTSDNMTFWLSHCPPCCSHWDHRPTHWQRDEN